MKKNEFTCCEDCLCEYIEGGTFCEKTQSKCPYTEKCHAKVSNENANKLRENTYLRNKKFKKKLFKRANLNHGVFIKENENGIPYPEEYYRSNGAASRSHLLRKMRTRQVRHFKGKVSNGGFYRKIFDFWWNLY